MNPMYNNYTVLFDVHSHTLYSDGSLTPEQNIQWHIANGYNAMALTDHNTLSGGLEAQKIAREKYSDKIKVLVGMEWTSCRLHLNLIGINETIPGSAIPTDEEIQSVINKTHELGGIVVVNHIPWSWYSLSDTPSIDQLYEWGADYIGVINDNTFDYQGYVFSMDHGMGVVSSSDMHRPNYGTFGWTAMIPENFSEEAIFQALKEKNTSLIYNAIESPYYANPIISQKNSWIAPWIYLGGVLIANYYSQNYPTWSYRGTFCSETTRIIKWKEISTLVGWIIGIFFTIELLKILFGFIIQKMKNKWCSAKDKETKISEMVPLINTTDEEDPVWK